jgi:hypothetical protein
VSKFDTVTKVINLAKVLVDGGVALSDAAARRREEERKRADEEKDRRIKELEAENARLKAGLAKAPPPPPEPTKAPGPGVLTGRD